MKRRLMSAVIGLLAILLLPGLASAHPLGNFTINHYARVTVSRDAISVRWVMDMAEIPAFAEVRAMDADGDGAPDPAAQQTWLDRTLPGILYGLQLTVDGRPVPLDVVDRVLSFPAGQGGLATLRLELDLRAPAPKIAASIGFVDRTYDEHIGWREVLAVAGAGVRLTASDVPSDDASDELRRYPSDAVTHPLAVASASVQVALDDTVPSTVPGGVSAGGPAPRPNDPLAALVGGDLTPVSAVLAVLLAVGLGALHGASPGHGKTLVAGYLIGTRGTLRQAIWLGVTVAVSHTVGVLVLGALTLAATTLILPERVIQWLTLGSALLVIGLGASLLRNLRRAHQHAGDHAHSHGQDHQHGHTHPHGRTAHPASPPPVSSRALAALGLVGGMVPSASALLVLLVSVTLHRLAFGILLVVAFGMGMAAVLVAISCSVVILRRHVGAFGWLRNPSVARIGAALPAASALAVVAVGIVLTVGATASLI